MTKYYQLTLGKLTRQLPLIRLTPQLTIASFVLLGDAELTQTAAKMLLQKITFPFDLIVTLESKGIPLAQALAVMAQQKRFIVLRKSIKPYMIAPLTQPVNSITTQDQQLLVLDGTDQAYLQNQRVLLLDDVISTGGSLQAAEKLLSKTGCSLAGKAAILAEGAAVKRTDIVYLKKLPLFA